MHTISHERSLDDVIRDLKDGRNSNENFGWLFERYHQSVFWSFVRNGISSEDSRDLARRSFLPPSAQSTIFGMPRISRHGFSRLGETLCETRSNGSGPRSASAVTCPRAAGRRKRSHPALLLWLTLAHEATSSDKCSPAKDWRR